ncbi:MAG: DUF1456 family protein [Thermodesulfobacteriota bacterium]|nr:DUF1456 family protein [Thermodesulfobacteriota bacterium]
MTNNDILRRFRYAVDLSDAAVLEIFSLVDVAITPQQLTNFFRREGELDYQELSPEMMYYFLDGLILFTRGKKEEKPGNTPKQQMSLNNNLILKKIRIALELREDDMLELFDKAQFTISRSELSALFRKKGHKNYKDCGDQLLRNFLKGLTLHNRK